MSRGVQIAKREGGVAAVFTKEEEEGVVRMRVKTTCSRLTKEIRECDKRSDGFVSQLSVRVRSDKILEYIDRGEEFAGALRCSGRLEGGSGGIFLPPGERGTTAAPRSIDRSVGGRPGK